MTTPNIEACQDSSCPDGKPYPGMRTYSAVNPRTVHFHTAEGTWYPPFIGDIDDATPPSSD